MKNEMKKFTLRLPVPLHDVLSGEAGKMNVDLATYCRLKLAGLVEQPGATTKAAEADRS